MIEKIMETQRFDWSALELALAELGRRSYEAGKIIEIANI
jgi:hypothetical protein